MEERVRLRITHSPFNTLALRYVPSAPYTRSTWYGSTLLGSTSQVVGGMDVVAAVEAVGTPGGQPTARVVIEDCGIEPEAKDSITDTMPEY